MKGKLAGYRHIPLQERIPLLLSHFFWGKAKGGRWETANWFLLLHNPTQVQMLISFWMKNPSWPPHPGPREITPNSCTNLSRLLQMSDGKAAMLWTLLLPASQGSLWVLSLSCNDHSCLLPLQHHRVSNPEGPAALPSPSHPMLWVCAETTSSTVAPGTNSLTGWRGSPPLSSA